MPDTRFVLCLEVKCDDGDKSEFVMDYGSGETVGKLRQLISNDASFPMNYDQIRLSFKGVELNDDELFVQVGLRRVTEVDVLRMGERSFKNDVNIRILCEKRV